MTLKHPWLLAVLAAPLFAQTAEISGLISDPSGLAVPRARITVQSAATGETRTVSSNGQGLYTVVALPAGRYDITIEQTGFRTLRQTGIVLEVDQRAMLNFTLSVGNTSESITVEGSAPLLNTSDASVSTVIGNQFVENLPLNGRSFSSLIDLAPGVVLTPANFYEQGQFSVNGQRPDANYFMVDGVSGNLGTAGFGTKSTALPPGRICGPVWATSPVPSFSNVVGAPPPAGTRLRPLVDVPPTTTLPSAPQLPPAGAGRSASGTTAPPSTEILFNLLPVKNPIHWPSGEKNGALASSVPGNSVAFG